MNARNMPLNKINALKILLLITVKNPDTCPPDFEPNVTDFTFYSVG